MNNDKINNSKKLAEYYVNFYKNNADESFKKITQTGLKDEVNLLIKYGINDKNYLSSLLESVGLSSDIIEINKEELFNEVTNINNEMTESEKIDDEILKEYKDSIEYVNNTIIYGMDSNLEKDFNNLFEQLENDSKSLNETLFETWINNYKNFVISNKLDEDMMFNYLEYIMKTKYNYDIANFKDLYYKENVVVSEKEEKENIEETNQNDETISKTSDNIEKIEVESKKLDDTINDTTEKKNNIVKSDDVVSENIDVSQKTDELQKQDPIEDITKHNNSVGTNEDKQPHVVSGNNKGLKIINVKKPHRKLEIMPLAIAAIILMCPTMTVTSILGSLLISGGVHIFANKYRNKKFPERLKAILDENGLSIKIDPSDNSAKIFDKKTGKELDITNSQVERVRYENIKKELVNIGAVKLTEEDYLKESFSGILNYKYKVNNLLKLAYYKAKNFISNKKQDIKNTMEERRIKNARPSVQEYEQYYNDDFALEKRVETEEKGRTR